MKLYKKEQLNRIIIETEQQLYKVKNFFFLSADLILLLTFWFGDK